jgi:predicted extracellular nuclease
MRKMKTMTAVIFIRDIGLCILLFPTFTFSQSDTVFRTVFFYNVENLFHPEKDSLKNDEAFTPEGSYRWTYKRYYRKVNQIAKTFLAVNQGTPPEIIGLAEVENEKALRQLCFYSPLKSFNYKYVHYDSPDLRGIDVALLYRKDTVTMIHQETIGITFPFEPNSKNRDILYVVFHFPEKDTIHLFINHWTSRFGGYATTIPKRNYYAQRLKNKIDSIKRCFSNPYIIVMGDFNDYPHNESLSTILQAKSVSEKKDDFLINLMSEYDNAGNAGSHKYEDFWGCLDQIIVSANLLTGNGLSVYQYKAHIMDAPFLLTEDSKYGGYKPFRTYLGFKYLGGFSDHLPVFVHLIKISDKTM